MRALFDTCILIDYLNGVIQARNELAPYSWKAISPITWMEVLVGAPPPAEPATRRFLQEFHLLDIDPAVREEAVSLRRAHRIELPDAIICSTARIHGLVLVTRNTKDFPGATQRIRIPH